VRDLSGKRQKSQQVSGVASAVPFLGETLPEKGKWEKEETEKEKSMVFRGIR